MFNILRVRFAVFNIQLLPEYPKSLQKEHCKFQLNQVVVWGFLISQQHFLGSVSMTIEQSGVTLCRAMFLRKGGMI
jgi:hypothetical protein